ncbi:hypothetical protein [Curtobacterium sp. PhB115]|uniref:hypothetical protein n=1 Tax=Curtobacterium sp. PhB115 TaxID=2485173 RepID=UPI000F4AFDC7|nr:hypothetical protein [Curtobacterium sp. PhB115]ROP74405.1 hypothetical protein EDF19_0489 [Curtobacterium sp. PhB115]
MGHGVQLTFGTILLLWGAFVMTFPQLIIKFAVAAEKAGLARNPQAHWGTWWVRLLGSMLGCAGLVAAVTALVGILSH